MKSTQPHAKTRSVLLRHTLPGGAWHYDWMIERAAVEERCLTTFRVLDRIDLPDCTQFRAERIEDHRAIYLDFEGELTGGRGSVVRLAASPVFAFTNEHHMTIELDFGFGRRRFVGSPLSGPRWSFVCSAHSESG